jgi:hypothetical protein
MARIVAIPGNALARFTETAGMRCNSELDQPRRVSAAIERRGWGTAGRCCV